MEAVEVTAAEAAVVVGIPLRKLSFLTAKCAAHLKLLSQSRLLGTGTS
jgi:hypothetical protein